jgi:arylsulfatase A-like enzyme
MARLFSSNRSIAVHLLHRITTLAPIALAAIVHFVPCFTVSGAENAKPPNIVIILADDLGYGEIVSKGPQPIPTPRVASIARNGVCFTNGYVTCPVCSPTRAGLLTGRYQQRFGHEFNPGPAQEASDVFGLPLTEITLADRLKSVGYATGIVGKWHEGFKPNYRPLRRGFDEFFGFLGGAHSYVDSGADKNNRILRGDESIHEKEYLTDALGREAVAFIDRHKQQPFFLYLAFNAVHAPLQTPEKYLNRFPQIENEKRRTFAAMLSAMDDNIGSVLDKLHREDLDEQTLVFFISDNGGPTPQTTSRNDPLHGFKAQVWEGGIRVPYLVQWKGHLPAGKIYEHPVSSLDIVPTAVAAAGGSLAGEHPLDGVDLVPYLSGANDARPHEKLYWRFGPQWAIRKGDLKLVKPPQAPAQLFDLVQDIGEQHDLSAQQPALVEELAKDYQQWNSELMAPRWKRQPAAGAAGQARRARQRKP